LVVVESKRRAAPLAAIMEHAVGLELKSGGLGEFADVGAGKSSAFLRDDVDPHGHVHLRAKRVELACCTERRLRVRTQGKTPCSFRAAAHRLAKARELSGIHDPRPVYELQPQLQPGVACGAAAVRFLPATTFRPIAERPDGLAAFSDLAQELFD